MIRRRGLHGYEEPVFQGGKMVGKIRRYSDRLLEILAKAHRPKFRENQRVEVSGPGGGPVETTVSMVDVVNAAAKAAQARAAKPPDEA